MDKRYDLNMGFIYVFFVFLVEIFRLRKQFQFRDNFNNYMNYIINTELCNLITSQPWFLFHFIVFLIIVASLHNYNCCWISFNKYQNIIQLSLRLFYDNKNI